VIPKVLVPYRSIEQKNGLFRNRIRELADYANGLADNIMTLRLQHQLNAYIVADQYFDNHVTIYYEREGKILVGFVNLTPQPSNRSYEGNGKFNISDWYLRNHMEVVIDQFKDGVDSFSKSVESLPTSSEMDMLVISLNVRGASE
jgi:hypothetical protein